jgi:hypothetical protein
MHGQGTLIYNTYVSHHMAYGTILVTLGSEKLIKNILYSINFISVIHFLEESNIIPDFFLCGADLRTTIIALTNGQMDFGVEKSEIYANAKWSRTFYYFIDIDLIHLKIYKRTSDQNPQKNMFYIFIKKPAENYFFL